ncbi:hydroxymethylglutaryl-CoA lyase [Desulfatitalea alkaliphila]|uniref:Hydroxymethylglutaryl-CoA lyase n=1 Tax=Desulfatitalea alkaliphila TaxID=2929485 RepID=A0AA41R4C0_9BACT|nr:hydroxymethylglutaryl-CoA lyase [Desulfatitalea alkaliphila]MCJ8503102.1 hydroxymethylglutaryl-CoA lyase [Desulfatitalea alkaliphila]
MVLPDKVVITEVGPRDGLQMERRMVPTATKVALIADLVGAGVPAVQVGAFVHPDKMPQMADVEAVIAALPDVDRVAYSALALNRHGVARACRTAIPWVEVSFSVSDAHSRRNTGMSAAAAFAEAAAMVSQVIAAGRRVRGSIQCAFGHGAGDPPPVAQVCRAALALAEGGVDLLVLADTAGLATPVSVRRLLEAISSRVGDLPVGLHLHDTHGLGLVNVMVALEMGIAHFDAALGGLGGCPFVADAAGNIATEDTLHLMHSLGVATGIDAARVAIWSRRLSALFDHPLPGRRYRLI